MFFTDPRFFLVAVPLLIIAFNLASKKNAIPGVLLLLVASLVLYYIESPAFLPLMVGCILLNFAVATAIERASGALSARLVFAFGVAFNLGLLAYYKYHGASFGGAPSPSRTLPLGVSFYSITLIVYLWQVYSSRKNGNLLDLAFTASFFPHLAAGPILNYKDMAPQLDNARPQRLEGLLRGGTLFSIGLAKKLFVADALARYADFTFDYAAHGPISMLYAWSGAFAFMFQLYFDFSGYSDMAIGISMLFGIALPMNFDSPLKARNLADFWQRWHMSLSRVLRELVFVPLGGLNRSKFRRYLALVVTMVIGGAWHGATINFWLFGLYSGLALCALHWYHGRAADTGSTVSWPPVAGLLATWLSLIVTVVFFRADTVQTAWSMFRGMAGFTGITSSPAPLSLKFSQFVPEPVLLNLHGLALWKFAILASGACVIVLAFRNSNEIVGVGRYPGVWRPSFKWGLFSGCMAALAIGSLGSASRFLYVNF